MGGFGVVTPEQAKDFSEMRALGIKRYRCDGGGFEIEFFEPPKPEAPSMPLDPVSLAKTFADQMPPDSALLFASSEDLNDEQPLNPSQGKSANDA